MKDKFKKAITAIIDKDDTTARKLIQEGIHQSERYIEYKKQLKDLGFDFETIDIDEKVYNDIEEVLKDFPNPVRLKILDEVYFKIAKNEK